METKISAILPNYNCAAFLPKALDSLVSQIEPFSEIIVIDDASTDESMEIIQAFQEKYDYIRLVRHEKNQGVCQSLNDGISIATGDYLLFCAADDWYDQESVMLAKQAIQKNPAVGMVGGDAMVYRHDQKNGFRRTLMFPKKNMFISPDEVREITQRGYVGFNGGGLFVNRMAVLEAGQLYPELQWCCDWLLHFVIAFRYGFYYVDQIFVHVLLRRESYSEQGKRAWRKQKEVLYALNKLLTERYPDLWQDFKKAALLPNYVFRYIWLFLVSPRLYAFASKRLFWRLFANNALFVRVGRLLPYRVIVRIRKVLCA